MFIINFLKNIIPLANESMYSFISRLANQNLYKIRWIFELFDLNVSNRPHCNHINSESLKKLSSMTNMSKKRLYIMTFHKYATYITSKDNIIYDNNLPYLKNGRYLSPQITMEKTKFCPKCLQENNYHRIYWNINLLTTCHKHNIFLQDCCPKCGEAVTTMELVKGLHKCGENLNNNDDFKHPSIKTIKNQKYLFNLFHNQKTAKERFGSQLQSLSDVSFINLFNFFLFYFNKTIYEKDSSFLYTVSNKKMNFLINKVFDFFDEYPKSFIRTLENETKSLNENTEKFYEEASYIFDKFRKIDRNIYRFLFEDLQSFFSSIKNPSAVKINLLQDEFDILNTNKYISKQRCCEVLNITDYNSNLLIENNIIESFKISSKKSQYNLISIDSVNKLLEKWRHSYTLNGLQDKFKASYNLLRRLLKYDIIKSYKKPYKNISIYLIPANEVDRIMELFFNDKLKDTDGEEWITIDEAINYFEFKNLHLIRILKLVSENFLSCKYKSIRFSKLFLNKFEVAKCKSMLNFEVNANIADKNTINTSLLKYINKSDQIKKIRENRLSSRNINDMFLTYLNQVRKLLPVSSDTLKKWTDKNLINFRKILNSKTTDYHRKIRLDDLYSFCKNFMFTEDAKQMLGLSHSSVINWVNSGYIKAYKDHQDGSRYIFNRNEIINIMNTHITKKEVSNYLGVSYRIVEEIIKEKRLNPIRTSGYLFNIEEVKKLKGNLDKLSCLEAGELLNLSAANVLRYVTDNKLRVVSAPYINNHSYKIRKIDLIKFKKEKLKIMNVSETAKYLNASKSQVKMWLREGFIESEGVNSKKKNHLRFTKIRIEYFAKDINYISSLDKDNLNFDEVTKFLGITRSYLKTLINSNKINYEKKLNSQTSIYLFDKFNLLKYKNKLYTKIVTIKEAANLLNVKLYWFKEKYVQTNRIKPIELNSIDGTFFDIDDINKLIKIKNEAINRTQAAKMIGVSVNTIRRWVKSGKLKAVSGPDVDGFGTYLFFKEDLLKQQ